MFLSAMLCREIAWIKVLMGEKDSMQIVSWDL